MMSLKVKQALNPQLWHRHHTLRGSTSGPAMKTAQSGQLETLQARLNRGSKQARLREIQRSANRGTADPLQRLVWPIGRDAVIESNFKSLMEGGEGDNANPAIREPDMPDSVEETGVLPEGFQPLSQLGDAETLFILGHGDGQGHIEGLDATAFVAHLIELGLTPDKTGDINVMSCWSGSAIPGAAAMTVQIRAALGDRPNRVIGYDGMVRVVAGQARVIPDARTGDYLGLEVEVTRKRKRVELISKVINENAIEGKFNAVAKGGEMLKQTNAEIKALMDQMLAMQHPAVEGENMSTVAPVPEAVPAIDRVENVEDHITGQPASGATSTTQDRD